MKAKPAPQSITRRAFTLVETLVVVSIIVLILAMTAPTLLRTMQGNKLSSAGDSLVGLFTEAQQMAATLNTPVEVRFYKYRLAPDSYEAFHSYQLFKVTIPTTGTGAEVTFSELFAPLATPIRLAEGVEIPEDPELCPLLDGEGIQDQSDDQATGYSGVENATYIGVRFMTDGSCRRIAAAAEGDGQLSTFDDTRPLNEFHLTLVVNSGRALTVATLPKNFYTIQIDPFSSKTRTYRPGQN